MSLKASFKNPSPVPEGGRSREDCLRRRADPLFSFFMTRRNKTLLILVTIPLFISYAWGTCVNPKPIEKTIIIDVCEVIDPYQVPRLKTFVEQYPKGFTESYKKEGEKEVQRIMESYEGAILVEKGGSKTEKYFISSKDKKICETYKKGATVAALVDFACCDGDPNPPCYLGFSGYVSRILETRAK